MWSGRLESIGWCGPDYPMLDRDDPWFGGCLQSVPSTVGVQVTSTSELAASPGSDVRLSEVVFESNHSALVKIEIATRGHVRRAELRIDERDGKSVVTPVCTPDPTWVRPLEDHSQLRL